MAAALDTAPQRAPRRLARQIVGALGPPAARLVYLETRADRRLAAAVLGSVAYLAAWAVITMG